MSLCRRERERDSNNGQWTMGNGNGSGGERERGKVLTWTSWALTWRCSARRKRNLEESRLVPEPMTRLAGNPDSFHATYVSTSTGLETISSSASGECSASAGTIFRNSATFRCSRFRRLSPGIWRAPAVTMARSEPRVTARSVSETRRTRGRNAAACCRSSISPRSLSGTASTSAISSAMSRVRMVCAIAIPTLPAPITDIFVSRRRCDVGVDPPSATGRKNPDDAPSASNPSSDRDEAFFMSRDRDRDLPPSLTG
ncbi:Os02g0105300 [Oryza sativa Japonica Group]|uniref:Uncharacterized protein n=2 Tax=Oryza sativa subsp. japonica TaxID=39947 RepID=Q6ZHL9_ORYSJ|nr:hypothetical protein EE612_008316 [Oryza sativa]BAD06282.1 unknown protein [Oryza sativa Japonica Group]BAD07542.1 unknown protein [Oryza sativa Japonica Group]BAD28079.1 unknown protein [Oryza sativa Japonica Group]BAS76558.1 Os02g0105300 [Oryza sativa Japonica Group]